MKEAPERYTDTLSPDSVSTELAPRIEALGLEANCRQLAMEGWTVIEDAASAQFTARLRGKILEVNGGRGGTDYWLETRCSPKRCSIPSCWP